MLLGLGVGSGVGQVSGGYKPSLHPAGSQDAVVMPLVKHLQNIAFNKGTGGKGYQRVEVTV